MEKKALWGEAIMECMAVRNDHLRFPCVARHGGSLMGLGFVQTGLAHRIGLFWVLEAQFHSIQ